MKNLVCKIVPALAAAGVLMLAGATAQAECIKKAGSGTGGNVDSAKFQAWEAVLQATDWGSWAAFMSARNSRATSTDDGCGSTAYFGQSAQN